MSTNTSLRLRGRTQLLPLADALVMRLRAKVIRVQPFTEVEERILHLLADGFSDLDRATADWPDSERARARELTETLSEARFLEEVRVSPLLLAEDAARFDRLLNYFSELEEEGTSRHERLRRMLDARVAVVGTGGMGSWLLYGLACCGVRNFVLVDADRVEPSNLNRSILFGEHDIGRSKVDAAAEALLRFAPRADIRTVARPVSGARDMVPIAGDVDMVVASADQPTWLIRQWLAEACRQTGRPLLHPSGLRVGPFYVPGRSACPMCEWAALALSTPAFPETVARMRRLPRGNSGGLATVASLTASVATGEVLRHLAGAGQPLTINGIWEWKPDGTAGVRPLPPQKTCPVCAGEGAATAEEDGAA
ncbi:ThiF family adenylyltransferase [Nonomuraea sp. K274]|uniref:ThiF family adenylyltransferase n=1 Tax=Nonomuraea cypriaca TaxID=1187855 RepID=A0A931A226_9ACTN|nr:ThiF family adenylyltransferase [Nonomuraea cypriaca]MBF8184771.1 ThiF family adenylyltransferase [Nonomuraea cypriaca]